VLHYVNSFLPRSMTFIYDQVASSDPDWPAWVVTRDRVNAELFPHEPLTVVPRSLPERCTSTLVRRLCLTSGDRTAWLDRQLESHLRDIRPVLVHAHFGPGGLAIWRAAHSMGIPVLVTFYGYDASRLLRSRAYSRDLARMLPHVTSLAVSEDLAIRLRSVGGPGCVVDALHPGTDLSRFAFFPHAAFVPGAAMEGRPRFLQISRFVEKKGHEYTVRSFARVAKKMPGATLVLVGDGPRLGEVRALVSSLGLDDRVSFEPPVDLDGVMQLFRASDVFVHHSVVAQDGDCEGIPTILMHAMASGIPVASTRHAGVPELIDDGITGFLSDERDVDGFAAAMSAAAMSDPGVALRARAAVGTRFNGQEQTRRLHEVYASLVETVRNHPE
jgi:colanic acid/amylovoran biosynthesis glycosyltransferase